MTPTQPLLSEISSKLLLVDPEFRLRLPSQTAELGSICDEHRGRLLIVGNRKANT
jgi:hypothetical protein